MGFGSDETLSRAELLMEVDRLRAQLREVEVEVDRVIAAFLANVHCSDCPAWEDGDCPSADDSGGPECEQAIRGAVSGTTAPEGE